MGAEWRNSLFRLAKITEISYKRNQFSLGGNS